MLRRAAKSTVIAIVLVTFTFNATGAAVLMPAVSPAMSAARMGAPLKGLPFGTLPPSAPKPLPKLDKPSPRRTGPGVVSSLMKETRRLGGVINEIAGEVVHHNLADARTVISFALNKVTGLGHRKAEQLRAAEKRIPLLAYQLGLAWGNVKRAFTPSPSNEFFELQMAAMMINGGAEERAEPRPQIFEARPLPVLPPVEAPRPDPEDLVFSRTPVRTGEGPGTSAFDKMISRLAQALERPADWVATPPSTVSPEPLQRTQRDVAVPEVTTRESRGQINFGSRLVRFPRLRPSRFFGSFGRSRLGGFRPLTGLNSRGAIASRFEGRWIEGDGISYRISYINPIAVSYADENGVHYRIPGSNADNPQEVIPSRFWGAYPIYRHKDIVSYEIEIKNTGTKDLRKLHVLSRQEAFNPNGVGRVLAAGYGNIKIHELKAGAKLVLRGEFEVTGSWTMDGSFEQTHIKVIGMRGKEGLLTLGENVHAGIIDPPPDDL